MLSYEDAKQRVFATGRVPDGYFGATQAVEFALVGTSIVTVADCGCFPTGGLPEALNTNEAFWLLQHHPSSRARQVNRT